MIVKLQHGVVLWIYLVFGTKTFAQQYRLESPNKQHELEITIGETIHFSLKTNGKMLMSPSEIGLIVDDRNLAEKPKVKKVETKTVNELLYPELRVKSEMIQNHYNELSVNFKAPFKLCFRAFDNGIAYRFETLYEEPIIINNEIARFEYPSNQQIYFPREEAFFSHNERLYEVTHLESLSNTDLGSLPTLINTDSGTKLVISESGLLDYPGMWLRGISGSNGLQADFPKVSLKEAVDHSRWTDDRSTKVVETANYIAKTQGNRVFPWRFVAIAQNDAELILNQLSYQLAEPSKLKNHSWIKPGKVAWDWWNYNNIYDVDFKAGINTETYKYYIDFASKYKLEYIILDEGWYHLHDVMDVVEEIDIQALTDYGKSKGVGVILWVTWSALDKKLDQALDTFEKWGVKGLKIDFMQRDDQWMVNYYERIAKACAEHKLLVNYHGAYKPSGLRRTYPNVLTREGVKGNENNKWADYITPTHNLTIPFIRMLAGPMDYTPGAMINTHKENFGIAWNKPMSLGTRCHQLAMYVCFESPLQMLCDSPSNYYKEEECMSFLSEVPAVWDETIVLKAALAEELVIARRKENNWYIGGMTNETPRNYNLDLSFLPQGEKYEMTLFVDGVNADRIAIDYKKTTQIVDAAFKTKLALVRGGGFVVQLQPIEK